MSGRGAEPVGPDRWIGLLLFLPVPLVLILFTRRPLGTLPSLAAGTVLMLTHAAYARPWALARAGRRCLWCGRRLRGSGDARPSAQTLRVIDPRGWVVWSCCSDRHLAAARRALRLAWRQRLLLRAGIGGTLAAFLLGAALAAMCRAGPVTPADAAAFFQLGIALVVSPLGWMGAHLSRRAGRDSARADGAEGAGREGRCPGGNPDLPAADARAPFPLHAASLIGLAGVLWLFRLVGLLWLAQGGGHMLRRLLASAGT